MKNIILILGILFGSFGIARFAGVDRITAGRIALSAVFLFTAIGHFVKSGEMQQMIPRWVPARQSIVWASGALELAFAIAVLLPGYSRITGGAIFAFLVLVTPLNIHSALNRIDFGGHKAGPRYLWLRIPLQIFLLIWTWWFTLR